MRRRSQLHAPGLAPALAHPAPYRAIASAASVAEEVIRGLTAIALVLGKRLKTRFAVLFILSPFEPPGLGAGLAPGGPSQIWR